MPDAPRVPAILIGGPRDGATVKVKCFLGIPEVDISLPSVDTHYDFFDKLFGRDVGTRSHYRLVLDKDAELIRVWRTEKKPTFRPPLIIDGSFVYEFVGSY